MADEKAPEPNVKLVVCDIAGEPVTAYDIVAVGGSAIALNGFHGSAVFEIGPQDTVVQVKFVNVGSVEPGPLPEKPQEETPPADEPTAEKATASTTKK